MNLILNNASHLFHQSSQSTLDLCGLNLSWVWEAFFLKCITIKWYFFKFIFTDFFPLLLWAWITFPFLETKVLGGIHCLEVVTWNRKNTVYSVTVGYLWKHSYMLQSYWDFQWTVMLFINYRRKSGQEMNSSPKDYYIPLIAMLC